METIFKLLSYVIAFLAIVTCIITPRKILKWILGSWGIGLIIIAWAQPSIFQYLAQTYDVVSWVFAPFFVGGAVGFILIKVLPWAFGHHFWR